MDKKYNIHSQLELVEEDSSSDHEDDVIIDDELTFKMGELFDNYEVFMERLEAHSKNSSVQYWKRDSRTVKGAFTKTNRHLNPKLVYYSLKYACIFGGQKFSSRSSGYRNCLTKRTDCPAHVTIRADKTGQKLEVVSVCNTHNHPITEEMYKGLPQTRNLSMTLKQEILDLLFIGMNRKTIIRYTKAQSDQILTIKDLINMASFDKKRSVRLQPSRIRTLLRKIKSYFIFLNYCNIHHMYTNSLTYILFIPDFDPEGYKTFLITYKNVDNDGNIFDSDSNDSLTSKLISTTELLENENWDNMQYQDSTMDPIGREVEICYTEDSIPEASMDGISYIYSESDTIISDCNESSDISKEVVIDDVNMNFKNEFLPSQSIELLSNDLVCDNTDKKILVPPTDEISSPCNVEIMNDCEMLINSQESEALYHTIDNENCVQLFSETLDKDVNDFENIIFIQDTSNNEIDGIPVQMLEVYDDNGDNLGVTVEEETPKISDSSQNLSIASETNGSVDVPTVQVENVANEEGGCLSCGRYGNEIRDSIHYLTKERDRLIRENTKLSVKRDRLKKEIFNMKQVKQIKKNAEKKCYDNSLI